MPEPAAAIGRQLEVFGRATTSTTTKCCRRGYTRLTVVDQRVEVTPNTRGTEAESRSDIGCGDRPLFQKKRDHGGPGVTVVGVVTRYSLVTCYSRRLLCHGRAHVPLRVDVDVLARGTG